MSEQADGFEGERRRAVTCDRRTERAGGYSICRCHFRSQPGPMFRLRHTALPATDSAQKPEESTVIFPDTLSVIHGVCRAAVRTTAIIWILKTVGRTHFPSTKVSVQSWYAARPQCALWR